MENRLQKIEAVLTRLERAEALLMEGRVHRVEGLPQTYVVRGSQLYLVDLGTQTCTCPDFQKGHTCKHILAAYLLARGEKKEVKEVLG